MLKELLNRITGYRTLGGACDMGYPQTDHDDRWESVSELIRTAFSSLPETPIEDDDDGEECFE